MNLLGDMAGDDRRARADLVTDLDATLFIEAGAGTGKTTAMVARITALIATARASAGSLVAITFTEAAAGELRARVRTSLELAAIDGSRVRSERERCHRAMEQLDNAVISTIHSFAHELLSSYPLEAGCPTRLDVLAPTAELVEQRERFRGWFEGAPDRGWGPPLQRLLLLGLRADDLEQLTSSVAREGDLLTTATRWPASGPPELGSLTEGLVARLDRLGTCEGLPPHGWTDALARTRLLRDRCASARSDDECIAALRLAETMPRVGGNESAWTAAGGGRDHGRFIKRELQSIQEDAADALARLRGVALCAILPHIRDSVLAGVAERRRRGNPTFQDLLAWARDLVLRDDIRARCRDRWSHIIVDEFQDTDPLQAELAVLLAATPDHDPRRTAWTDAALIPGRLCVVGDPKQSIYRFRRADIALYERVRTTVIRSGGKVLTLSRNHRSAPAIIDLVNRHFSGVLVERTGVQAGYVPLHPHRDEAGDSVWVMGGAEGGRSGEVWASEAALVASAARQVHDDRWEVDDQRNGRRRAATYRDICVLIPTRTNMRRLERAFDDASVPYRLESGALILETQEVRDLLATLRAIDDPSDQVALVTALRSPAYGCSDVELHRWVSSGGQLDALNPRDGGVARVSLALSDLAGRHHRRHDISVAAVVEQLVADRMVDVAAFAQRRPREALRRLRWVADEARAIAASGLGTLRETVDLLESMRRDAPPTSAGAATESDEDSVRVLTVHGSKGLEFPVVIMTGMGSDFRPRLGHVLVDRLAGRIEASVRAGEGGSKSAFATTGYAGARATEEEFARAEHQRLLYVAATRARDHLVVSVCRPSAPGRGGDAGAWARTFASQGAAPLQTLGLRPHPVRPAHLRTHHHGDAAAAAAEDDAEKERLWIAARQQLITDRASEVIRSATSIAHAPANPETAPPDIGSVTDITGGTAITDPDTTGARGGGTAIGRAVHAVLEAVPLDDAGGIEGLAGVHAVANGIPGRVEQVAQLALRAWSSGPVRRAADTGRYWREVPVGAPLDGALVEGIIDLLYEDGTDLVIVDHKTDDVQGAEIESRMAAYRVQGEVYARLVAAVTGREVARCEFIFAATGAVVTVGRATLSPAR